MAQANLPPVLCLGCGEDIPTRTADRRTLQGPAAEVIVDEWKAVFESLKVGLVVDEEAEDRLSVDNRPLL